MLNEQRRLTFVNKCDTTVGILDFLDVKTLKKIKKESLGLKTLKRGKYVLKCQAVEPLCGLLTKGEESKIT